MAAAQPSMGMGEEGRFGAGSQTPDPRPQTSASGRPRKGAAKGAKARCRCRRWGQLPDAIRSPSSNLPPAPWSIPQKLRVAVFLFPCTPPCSPGSPSPLSPNLRFIFLGGARVRASAGCGPWPSTFRRGRSRAMINPPFIRRLIQMSVEATSAAILRRVNGQHRLDCVRRDASLEPHPQTGRAARTTASNPALFISAQRTPFPVAHGFAVPSRSLRAWRQPVPAAGPITGPSRRATGPQTTAHTCMEDR